MSGGLWLTIDPSQFYEISPSALMNVVYETLYHLPDSSKPDEFEPLLADGMPEVSEDGLQVTIKLRSGVKFHNTGNEMTADDWVFSWDRLKTRQETPSYLASYWETVEAVDPSTLRLTLTAPNPALVAILTSSPLAVTDSKTVREHGGTGLPAAQEGEGGTPGAGEPDSATAYINENSVGTGPYRVVQYDVDTEVIIERNPDYWGDAAAFERIIWRNVTDTNAQLELVQTGDADIAFSLDPDAVAQVEQDENLQLLTGDTISLEYLALHTQEDPGGPLARKELRQAMAHAVDYDGIIEELLAGAATRPATIVPLPMAGSEELRARAYETDLARAQELFDAAGGGDVTITLTYAPEYPGQGGVDAETLAAKIQSDLQQIDGLTVELDPRETTAWIDGYRASELQFTLAPWGPDYPDIQSYVEPFGRSGQGVAARVGYENPAVDEALDRAVAAEDQAGREAAYVEVQEALIEDVPFIVLYQPSDRRVARKGVEGLATHFLYGLQLRYASKSG